ITQEEETTHSSTAFIERVSQRGKITRSKIDPLPSDSVRLLVDRHGVVWAQSTGGDAAGFMPNGTRLQKSLGSPNAFGQSIQLAIGSDGEAWYARARPIAQIGRVDGSRVVGLPSGLGEPEAFAAASDGSMWEVTSHGAMRIGAHSGVRRIAVPAVPHNIGLPYPLLVAGTDGTMLYSNGRGVYWLRNSGIVNRYLLPDATTWITAMAFGCDGALYIAENDRQLTNVPLPGAPQRYPIDAQYFGLAPARNCGMWFLSDERIGVFSLVSR
ncbi:MAG TPA: hypothetical protein VFA29_07615, partial [Candidatus Baltobacteraceae bacterium]|nr:hypothetical protein [Candidatus Baltobacteraceae bacterium]